MCQIASIRTSDTLDIAIQATKANMPGHWNANLHLQSTWEAKPEEIKSKFANKVRLKKCQEPVSNSSSANGENFSGKPPCRCGSLFSFRTHHPHRLTRPEQWCNKSSAETAYKDFIDAILRSLYKTSSESRAETTSLYEKFTTKDTVHGTRCSH